MKNMILVVLIVITAVLSSATVSNNYKIRCLEESLNYTENLAKKQQETIEVLSTVKEVKELPKGQYEKCTIDEKIYYKGINGIYTIVH